MALLAMGLTSLAVAVLSFFHGDAQTGIWLALSGTQIYLSSDRRSK